MKFFSTILFALIVCCFFLSEEALAFSNLKFNSVAESNLGVNLGCYNELIYPNGMFLGLYIGENDYLEIYALGKKSKWQNYDFSTSLAIIYNEKSLNELMPQIIISNKNLELFNNIHLPTKSGGEFVEELFWVDIRYSYAPLKESGKVINGIGPLLDGRLSLYHHELNQFFLGVRGTYIRKFENIKAEFWVYTGTDISKRNDEGGFGRIQLRISF